mgnify:CR=1 FL=1
MVILESLQLVNHTWIVLSNIIIENSDWRLGTCCQFIENKNRKLNFIASTKSQAINNPERCIEKAFINTTKLIDIMNFLSKEPKNLRLFRIRSDIWPCYSVPEIRPYYRDVEKELIYLLRKSKAIANKNEIRLSMHPDQFCVLGSKNIKVVKNSITELEYHAKIGASLVDNPRDFVINIHLQGIYGGSHLDGIKRFATNFSHLSPFCKKALTVENEDYSSGYDINHILELSEKIPIRACIDMHHYEAYHQGQQVLSYKDSLVKKSIQTWEGVRPLFHASQPIKGSHKLAPHSDQFWDTIRNERYAMFLNCVDLDIEAKEKERAVKTFYNWIKKSKKLL